MSATDIKLVSFDCAHTLIHVDWNPIQHLIKCAGDAGAGELDVTAPEKLERLVLGRWRDWQIVNLQRSEVACRAWWAEVVVDWLNSIGQPISLLEGIESASDRRMFGEPSDVYRLYPDTLPAIQSLKAAGYRLAVLSNWDQSLHRVIRMFHLEPYFEIVIASLEEGVEKPNAEIFAILSRRAGLEAHQIVHIGDHPIDDFQAASRAGMQAALLDRATPEEFGERFSSLTSFADSLIP